MTKQEYLKEFEKHLRVAEPKRGEIFSEVEAHLTQMRGEANIEKQLGSPKVLAGNFDFTHIGRFGTGMMVFLTPIASIFLYLVVRPLVVSGVMIENEAIGVWVFIFFYWLCFVPPLFGALITGTTIVRLHKPILYAGAIVILSLITLNVVGLIGFRPEIGDTDDIVFLQNYLMSLLQLPILIVVGCVGYRFEKKFWKRQPKVQIV